MVLQVGGLPNCAETGSMLLLPLRGGCLAWSVAFSVEFLAAVAYSGEFFPEMGSHAQLAAFKALVQAVAAQAASHSTSKFVKKMDEIPSLELSPSDPCQKALTLSEKALIGKFTGLWPSPKAVEL